MNINTVADFAFTYTEDGHRAIIRRGPDEVLFDTSRPRVRNWLEQKHRNGMIHEPWFSYTLARLILAIRPRVYFDIGAFIGYFTVMPLPWLDPDNLIVAFEMNRRSYGDLIANVSCNTHLCPWRVLSVNAGLSDEVVLAAPVSVQAFALERSPGFPPNDRLDILTLDHYCSVTGLVPDLIKLDVEGYEAPIFRGARNLLRNHSPTIIFELHSEEMLARRGSSRSDVLGRLEAMGYALFLVGGGRRAMLDRDQPLVPVHEQERDRVLGGVNTSLVAARGGHLAPVMELCQK